MFNDLHQVLEVGQDGAAHEDGDLLYDLDARVAGLPRLLTAAHCLQEGQQRRDAERRGDDCEGTRCRVAHVLVHVVNVRPHRRDHRGEAGRLRRVWSVKGRVTRPAQLHLLTLNHDELTVNCQLDNRQLPY